MVHGGVKVIARRQKASWGKPLFGFTISGTKELHTRGLWFMIYWCEINASRHNIPPNGGRVHSTCTTRKRNDKPRLQFFSIFLRLLSVVHEPWMIFYYFLCLLSNALLSRYQPLQFCKRRRKRRGIYASEHIDEKSRVPSQRGVSTCRCLISASGVANTLKITINLPEREA